MKPVGKPDALIGHVRFDERGWETGRRSVRQCSRPSSTLQKTRSSGIYPVPPRLAARESLSPPYGHVAVHRVQLDHARLRPVFSHRMILAPDPANGSRIVSRLWLLLRSALLQSSFVGEHNSGMMVRPCSLTLLLCIAALTFAAPRVSKRLWRKQ